ncbi:MAG: phosphatase PAP2 family protein [Patescibacteria group bacterium]|nr:phosphatase PAP2 family protein [Patescibacteria group bacterium]
MTGKRTYVAHAISMLGSWWGIVCSIILVFLIHPVPLQKGLSLLIWGFIPTVASECLKFAIRRPRPAMRGESVKVKAYGYSFPSSHTVAATMLASWILLVPEIRWWSWLFLLWPITVGWSRVWLRAHDWVDIVGGVTFGAIFSVLFRFLL